MRGHKKPKAHLPRPRPFKMRPPKKRKRKPKVIDVWEIEANGCVYEGDTLVRKRRVEKLSKEGA